MINGYGLLTEPQTVRFERVLPGPIERVWDFLTDPEQRGRWLAPGPMELREGGAVELRFHHADLSDPPEPFPERYKDLEGGHTVHGKVLRCHPPRLLAYSWGEGGDRCSEVTFELAEEGDRVRLVLTHVGLAGRPLLLSVAAGWHTHLQLLETRLGGGRTQGFWSMHEAWREDYDARIPAEVA